MRTIKQLLMMVALLLCSVAVSAHDFEVDGIYYKILSSADLTVAVTYKGNAYNEFDNEYSGKIIIPSTVIYKSKTLSVTSIGEDAFKDCSGLTSVTIGNSVTSIGDGAFKWCIGLTSVTIGNSVTSIGDGAFEWCIGLTSITIPNSVTSIGEDAFKDCSGLTSVTIGNSVTSIGEDAFKDCTGLTKVTLNCKKIESWFLGLTSIKEVVIGNSVTSIGGFAFYGCSLTSVTIGNSVKSIESYAFYGCSGLTSVTIGNSVTSIGGFAFYGCSGLTSIYLLGVTPPTVESGNFTESQYANLTLYVPKGSLETYQSADTWKIFWDIQEFDATGIEGVNANDIAIEVTANGITLSDADGKTVAIYSANGTRVANIGSYVGEEITLDRGVYIVRVGNNTLKVKL